MKVFLVVCRFGVKRSLGLSLVVVGGRERGQYSRTNGIEGLADLEGLATMLAWQEGTAHHLGETKG